jgi:hypothetical protein
MYFLSRRLFDTDKCWKRVSFHNGAKDICKATKCTLSSYQCTPGMTQAGVRGLTRAHQSYRLDSDSEAEVSGVNVVSQL